MVENLNLMNGMHEGLVVLNTEDSKPGAYQFGFANRPAVKLFQKLKETFGSNDAKDSFRDEDLKREIFLPSTITVN